jgi:hypothetical protein
MKHIHAALAGAVALSMFTPVFAENPQDPNAAEAKGIVKEFFTSLKGELQAAVSDGGPVNAIGVCKDRAPAIARKLSEESGWDVGRTSLKTRNPELNSPDSWERQVLLEFEERKAAGEDVKPMAHAAVVETDIGKHYRFMKAIPTGEICLACHGESISPDVATAIREAYPQDQATGFSLGDIRGAFTLSKPL